MNSSPSSLDKHIKIIDKRGKVLTELTQVMKDVTIEELKQKLVGMNSFPGRGLSMDRVRLQLNDNKGAVMDRRRILNDYSTNSEMTLLYKDLGPQVSWKTVFLVEYFGPIAIALILKVFRKQIYNSKKPLTFNQKLGLAMAVGHYLKRELETLFVHRFSNDTMPFFNIFKNSFHYWFIFGFINMYWFLHPDYKPPKWAKSKKTMWVIFGLFCFFEFMNLMCHITLRDLRKPGSAERGIPQGWGFQLVSCANYFWEFMAWLTFALQSGHSGSYIFLAVSMGKMTEWAIQKHKRYHIEFKDYPKSRKIILPYIF